MIDQAFWDDVSQVNGTGFGFPAKTVRLTNVKIVRPWWGRRFIEWWTGCPPRIQVDYTFEFRSAGWLD